MIIALIGPQPLSLTIISFSDSGIVTGILSFVSSYLHVNRAATGGELLSAQLSNL
jgi:hypothetical protein